MKKWSVDGGSWLYAAGMALYLLGLNLLAFSFRYKDIAVASTLLIIFNILSLTAAGVFLFDETLSASKVTGLLLFTIAILCFEAG